MAGKLLPTKQTGLNNEGIRVMTPTEWGRLQGFIGYAFVDENGEDKFSFPEGIYTQSVGSVMSRPQKGRFPLNISYRYVKNFDGENDGLVGESSFAWGEKYTLLRTEGKRGISHGDMIDLNRENIKDFDVRAFYTELVNDLRERGL